MKEKILLISGCSHTGGSEIDGSQDSVYNRENSFGGLLAKKLNRRPINCALVAMSNRAIARSVLDWFNKFYDSTTMDVMVLFGWTEAIRIDFPDTYTPGIDYLSANTAADYYSKINERFLQINAGWAGGADWEKEVIPYWHDYQAKHESMCELDCINIVLQMQYFCKMNDVDYLMCNTMKMFSPENSHLQFYIDLIDQSKYMNMLDNDKSFYWYYRNAGYSNPKAKYWHHDETPHRLYADELFNFYSSS